MSIGWLIGLVSASILFYTAYFFLSSFNYKNRFKQAYDLRNHFPYEFNYESKFVDNILGNIALIFSIVFSISYFACSAVYKSNNGLLMFSLVSGVIFSILVLVMNFIPLKYMRTHMIFSVLLFVASFFLPSSIALTSFKEYQDSKAVVALVMFIVIAVIAICNFVLVMNPKLTFNIKMQVAKDDEGNEHYVRPKFIMMAMSEWIVSFGLFLSQILLLIILIII